MVVGSHSHTHRVLSKLSSKLQSKELVTSCKELEKIIKQKIKFFAYPYGGFEVFNRSTIDILRKNHIKYCFNVESKDWSKYSNKFYIPRYDCNEFKYGKIFNYKSFIQKRKKTQL
jgi:peptidoglycan/xylan/chitin deacetylase (PgdA/CDA1 family)